MYFSNFFSKIFLINSLKKKFPIVYKTKAPKDIEITETIVPNHFPNIIPEIIKSGAPKPNSETHKIENKKK